MVWPGPGGPGQKVAIQKALFEDSGRPLTGPARIFKTGHFDRFLNFFQRLWPETGSSSGLGDRENLT